MTYYIYGCQKDLRIPQRREPTPAEKEVFKRLGKTEQLRPAPITKQHSEPVILSDEEKDEYHAGLMGEGPAELVYYEAQFVPHCRCDAVKHLHRIWLQTDETVQAGRYGLSEDKKSVLTICQQVNHLRVHTDLPPIAINGKMGGRAIYGAKIKGRFNVVFQEYAPIETGFCPCGSIHKHRMWIETDAEVECYDEPIAG